MDAVSVNLAVNDRRIAMTFDRSSPVQLSMLNQLQNDGAYEKASHLFLMRVLRAGDVFVDIGAHIGYFSMLAAAVVGGEGRVLAVEPVAENFQRLSDHMETNGLTQAEAVRAVISDRDGEAEIHVNADNDGGHALWDPADHPSNERTRQDPRTERVHSRRLETLLAERAIERVRLVKIDTEGAEALVLGGARGLFARGTVDFVIMEVNMMGLERMGADADALFALARDLGFVICLPRDDGTAPVLLAGDNRPDPTFVYNVILARPGALETL